MSRYGAVARTVLRVVALVGILPGAIVAGAYLLVLTGQLYQHWDLRTAIVLGMAAWGVFGVLALWHEYVRSSRNRAGAKRTTVSPRALLIVWAFILVAVAGWKLDERPWIAAFLAVAALYAFVRAFGLLRFVTRSASPASGARARGGERTRARAA